MPESTAEPSAPTVAGPRSERVEAAATLYRRFHGRCFWHCPRDLEVTEECIPFVIQGLKIHGGREGFRLAAELQRIPAADEWRQAPDVAEDWPPLG